MTDAFDVSLRVKLDYQAAAPARAAVGDLEAIAAAAKRLGASSTVVAAARDMGALRQAATVARAGLDDVAAAGARLGRSAGEARPLSSELARVGTDAASAARAVDALGGKLAAVRAEAGRASAAAPSDPLQRQVQEALRAQRAKGGFGSGAELEAFLKTLAPPATSAAATAAAPTTAPAPSAPPPTAPPSSPLPKIDRPRRPRPRDVIDLDRSPEATFRRLADAGRRARRDVLDLGGASAKLGQGEGPKALAGGLDAVAGAAHAARRSVDDLGRAAVRTARDTAAMRAGGGGHGGGGGEGEAPAAGHAGPSGLRGALVAAARPLHMERLLMSATTPTGLMGLGAGVGLFEAVHRVEDATKRAIELEDALAEIRRTAGDMPADGVKALEGSILRTSRATGATAGELARVGAEAAAAGRPAAELPRFMDLSAKAAGGFGATVEAVGGRLTKIGADFGLDQGGVERLADAAALLQERTGARGAGTLDVVAAAGGTAHLAGMAPEQVAAFGAGMGKLGIADPASLFAGLLDKLVTAPMQGGGFKTGLSRIPGPDGAPESPYALRNAMLANPSAGMMRFLEDVRKLPEARRQFVLGQMFGPEDAEKVGRMADHLDDFRKNLATVQDAAARNGAVGRVFSLFDETTSKKIDRATAAVGAFATKIGQSFAPAVGAAAESTARFFGGWLDRMDRLEKAGELAGKIGKGIALTAEEAAKLDADPALKAETGRQVEAGRVARARDAEATPDPAAGRARELARMGAPAAAPADAEGKRERDRLALVEAIRANTVYARAHGGVGADEAANLRAAYEAQYPDKPLPAFARGGRVTGPGGPREDRVLARLSADEFVVNASAYAKHRHLVHAINDDALPGFADGGAVGALAAHAAGQRPDPSASARLEDTIARGVKEGVVAGLREARDAAGSSAGGNRPAASWEQEGSDAAGAPGGGGSARRSIRYGGGYGPGGRRDPDGTLHRRSLRFGGGYGPVHGGRAAGSPAPHRRGSRSAGDGGGVPDADYQTEGNQIDGLTKEGTRQYAAVLGKRESGNRYGIENQYGYVGRWQMGADALAENGYVKKGTKNRGLHDPNSWTGKGGIHSLEEFKANKGGVQDREFTEYTNRHYAQLKRAGVIRDGMSQAEVAGWLAAAHLKGVGGAIQLSRGHDNVDANGTSASSYRRMMAGVGQGAASPGLAARPRSTPDAPASAEDRVTRSTEAERRTVALAADVQALAKRPDTLSSGVQKAGALASLRAAGPLTRTGAFDRADLPALRAMAHAGAAPASPQPSSAVPPPIASTEDRATRATAAERAALPGHVAAARRAHEGFQRRGYETGTPYPLGMSLQRMTDLTYDTDKGVRPGRIPDGYAQDPATGRWRPHFGEEDRASRSSRAERDAAAGQRALDRRGRGEIFSARTPRPGPPPLSPRFTDPGLKMAYEGTGRPAGAGAAPGGRGAPGATPVPHVTQNFYGQHDPRETARHAKRESNREIRRAQARALHGTGRPA